MNEFGSFDLEMLGITQDQIKEVDSSEAEVVSRVLMSRIRDIVVTIRPDGIMFNATCIRSMVGVIHVQMYIDRAKHRLYVQPAAEFDKDSRRWCNEKDGKRVSRKITGRPFGDRIYKMMGWSKGYSYRVVGYPSVEAGTEDEYLLCFDLDEFDQNLLTERGMESAGVEDTDLGENAEQIRAAMAEEKAQKEKAREEAKSSGKRKRARKKARYFDAVEDGAFGVRKKDHIDRIIIPPLEQLELLEMSEDSVRETRTTLQGEGDGT